MNKENTHNNEQELFNNLFIEKLKQYQGMSAEEIWKRFDNARQNSPNKTPIELLDGLISLTITSDNVILEENNK